MKQVTRLRIIALVCAIILVFSVFVACSRSDDQTTTTTTGAATTTTAAAATTTTTTTQPEEEPYKEHIKFTFSSVDSAQGGRLADGRVAGNWAWLTEKFNFDFDFISLNWGNYIDQTRIWLAAGDAPELMMLDIHFSRYPEYIKWVEEGLFRPYPEFGTTYPNLQRIMDTMISGKKFYVDGVLYAWPAYLDLEQYDFRQILLPYYRRDWAKAVGMFNENDEYTLDEWTALVKEAINKDPGGLGQGRTIGMHGRIWTFPKFFGPGTVSPYMEEFVQTKDGNWVWGPALPETLEAIKLTRQLYDDGVIWEDQIIVQDAQASDPFNSGRSFAYITNITAGGMKTQADNMVDAIPGFNPKEDLGIAFIKGVNGKILTRHMPDQWSQTAMNKDLSDKKAERWLDIMEYLVSQEGYYFRHVGIPDEDWKMENGELVILWPEVDGAQEYPYNPSYPNNWTWRRSVGLSDGFDLINPANPDWVKERVIYAYERLNESDVHVVELDADLAYFSHPEYDTLGHNVSPERVREVAIELMVYDGDIEEKWNEFINEALEHVNPVIDVLNENLK